MQHKKNNIKYSDIEYNMDEKLDNIMCMLLMHVLSTDFLSCL